MKLADITKSFIDLLVGESPERKLKWNLHSKTGVMEQINDAERSVYQQSQNSWIDYNVYVNHNNHYRQREEMMYEQMRQYAMQMGVRLTDYKKDIVLNKNIKVL